MDDDKLYSNFYGTLRDMTFTVDSGDVYVNGDFVGQLCWSPQQIGDAIARYIASNFS